MKEKREYQDTVFRDLLGLDRDANERFLEVAGVLFHKNYPKDTPLRSVDLEHVLYTGLRNDIARLLDNKLIIFMEHQSTINENMPLRFFEYGAAVYQNLLEPKDRYRKKRLMIPPMSFYVFYTGDAPYPEEKILRLSDSYIFPQGETNLELTCKVLNLRKNAAKIFAQSKTIRDYSVFIDRVKKYQKENKKDGMERAIRECIAEGILGDYLYRKAREVENMLTAEYDYDMDIAVQAEERAEERAEEAWEGGRKEGRKEGETAGVNKVAKSMLLRGVDLQFVMDCTGLSKEKALALQQAL